MNEFPFVAQLIDEGYAVSFNDSGLGKQLVTVCDEGGQLILFDRGRMSYQEMMERLDSYAKELFENGMANDEINGFRGKIW
jgi:hypothetical protein